MTRQLALLTVVPLLLLGCGEDRRRGDGVDSGPVPVDAGPALDAGSDAGSATDSGPVGSTFVVDFDTTAGAFAIEVDPDWAPLGAARFRELVEAGFYDDCRFFRVVPGFMVQFGINGDPAVSATWRTSTIADDPVMQSNTPGMVTFATAGPDTRTTQLFINYGNNSGLDSMGFAPFGRIVEGMESVDAINAEYGEMPNQGQIQSTGNAYLDASFPNLDYIRTATIR